MMVVQQSLPLDDEILVHLPVVVVGVELKVAWLMWQAVLGCQQLVVQSLPMPMPLPLLLPPMLMLVLVPSANLSILSELLSLKVILIR